MGISEFAKALRNRRFLKTGKKTLKTTSEKAKSSLAKKVVFSEKKVALVIPTHNPDPTTVRLVRSLREFHPRIKIVVVNDCIKNGSRAEKVFKQIEKLAKSDRNVICLKTPKNSHKAGALNLGIDYLTKLKSKPDAIFTTDDDIVVNEETLPTMIRQLFSSSAMGAVCSKSLVKNKDINWLTRLQALEYHGFTISKIADNDFLYGPLVMQGMIAGFKTEALEEVSGFTPNHLIEDYDITVRLKRKGWKVSIAKNAAAWTEVPEKVGQLWRQRVRWGYWGIKVVRENMGFLPAIFQDLLGHSLFISLLALVVLSFVFYRREPVNDPLIMGILVLAAAHFVVSYIFNIVSMFSYEQRDLKDWVIKLTVVPELIYSNVITIVLLGCYIYYLYNLIMGNASKRIAGLDRPYKIGLGGFKKIGYSTGWGTS